MTTGMRRPSVRAASTWLLAALLAVVLAACAQDAGTGIATAGDGEEVAPTDSTNTNPAPVDPGDAGILYAQCMRDNGVPDFPDPGPDGRFSLDHGEHDPDDPTFRAAAEECRDLAPGGEHRDTGDAAYVEQMRDFAQCMRDKGLPDFPDPDAEGRLRGLGHGEGGIDRNDPKFRAAREACAEAVPGAGDHR